MGVMNTQHISPLISIAMFLVSWKCLLLLGTCFQCCMDHLIHDLIFDERVALLTSKSYNLIEINYHSREPSTC